MASKPEDFKKADARAKTLSAEGSQFEAGAFNLGPQVMEAVRADRQQRGVSQLATDVGNTLGQLASDPAAIRQRAGDVVNPFDVDALTASQRGQTLKTLGTISTQSELNQGLITDVIGEETDKFRALATAKLAEAEQAQNEAQSIFQQIQFEEGVRQFNESLAEKQRQFNTTQAGKGSGGGVSSGLASVIAALDFGKPTEAEPQYTPQEGEGTTSKDGQWTYTNGKWQPNQTGGFEGMDKETMGRVLSNAVLDNQISSADAKFALEQYYPEEEEVEIDEIKAKIIGDAAAVVQVIENKDSYASKEAYNDALNYVASEYNKRAFGEGGKALTKDERAVIAGTQIRTRTGMTGGSLAGLVGWTPPSASRLIIDDDEETILRKMKQAQGLETFLPESWEDR